MGGQKHTEPYDLFTLPLYTSKAFFFHRGEVATFCGHQWLDPNARRRLMGMDSIQQLFRHSHVNFLASVFCGSRFNLSNTGDFQIAQLPQSENEGSRGRRELSLGRVRWLKRPAIAATILFPLSG